MKNIIEVVGLGAGDVEQLPLGIYRKLTANEKLIFARTINHPVITNLNEEGIHFISLDEIYEQETDFQVVYERIVKTLVEKAKESSIIYAVPGHPMLAEKTVQLLLAQTDVPIKIIGGQSYLDDLFTALKIDPIDGFQFLDATSLDREEINYSNHLVFCQVYDSFISSNLKLTLLEDLPPDYEIVIVDAAGTEKEVIKRVILEDLDRVMKVSNLTSVYIPPVPPGFLKHQFSALRKVIETLRGPNGCPWDRKQTHETLRKYAIEEVYELIDAIDREDDDAIIEELGDVLLQVMLHSQIGEDNGYFSIDDVIRSLVTKMIHRHPHVFEKKGPHKTWDELKQEESGNEKQFLLESVIAHGPSLHVAEKIQKKAAKIGFDWADVQDVWEKLSEEIAEFHEASSADDRNKMEEEFGDILFVLANLSRFYQIDPELALRRANRKFISRFTRMEKIAQNKNIDMTTLSLAELDKLWDKVKQEE